jgi:hypothetical protein
MDRAPEKKSQYEALASGIRDFLREQVAIRVLGKRKSGALNDIFGLANFGEKQSDQINEAIKEIRVSSGHRTASKTIWGKSGTAKPIIKPPVVKPPAGRNRRDRSFPIADIGVEVPVSSVKDELGIQFRLTNIRPGSKNAPVAAKMWFNAPTTGPAFQVEIVIAGDSQYSQVPIRRKSDEAWSWSVEFSATKEIRRSMEIEIGTTSVLGATVIGLLSGKDDASVAVSFEDEVAESI